MTVPPSVADAADCYVVEYGPAEAEKRLVERFRREGSERVVAALGHVRRRYLGGEPA